MPAEAKRGGAFIIGTGRSDFPNQINNVLVFPGLFKGLLENKIKLVTDEIKIAVAETIAHILSPAQLKTTNILPNVLDQRVATAIARKLIKFKN
jgi:malate dehydrogenase (oxaloacetate-decarboxylating)